MKNIRPPAVAGQFYPESAKSLRHLVDDLLTLARDAPTCPPAPASAVAAVVPHAGLVYSGACAARVYAEVALPPVVVILAPNHTGVARSRERASLWDTGAFDTPLGPIPVAEEFAAALRRDCPLVHEDQTAHRYEHAIEVELPFVAVVAPSAAIVPIVLPWATWDECRRLGECLAAAVDAWAGPVLLLASSDMTHYEAAEAAARKDRLTFPFMERLDGSGLLHVCEREQITMCGRGPAAVVLEAARHLGARGAHVVDYRHSGLVTGDTGRVVSYAGVVIR